MELRLWKAILAIMDALPTRRAARLAYSDAEIVAVFYWAVIHDRPISWACRPAHWPIHLRGRRLPSGSTVSRRLRSASVVALLTDVERRVTAPREGGIFWMLDGKPLPIGGCSKDSQAGYGRAAGGKAKGYKMHALVGADGSLAGWRLAPMNVDERVMAARMLRRCEARGYIVADTNYDSNPLHAICEARGDRQLVTRRRYGPWHGLGHKEQTAGRLRSVPLTEGPWPGFAEGLLRDRSAIERKFGHLVSWGGGLTTLPPWVRTYRRVYRWVQAKLTLAAIRLTRDFRAYVG